MLKLKMEARGWEVMTLSPESIKRLACSEESWDWTLPRVRCRSFENRSWTWSQKKEGIRGIRQSYEEGIRSYEVASLLWSHEGAIGHSPEFVTQSSILCLMLKLKLKSKLKVEAQIWELRLSAWSFRGGTGAREELRKGRYLVNWWCWEMKVRNRKSPGEKFL